MAEWPDNWTLVKACNHKQSQTYLCMNCVPDSDSCAYGFHHSSFCGILETSCHQSMGSSMSRIHLLTIVDTTTLQRLTVTGGFLVICETRKFSAMSSQLNFF